MIHFTFDPVQEIDCDVLVCPVNCVGVMGKGLAKVMKIEFPYCVEDYMASCKNNELEPGTILLTLPQPTLIKTSRQPPIVIHAATKNHWRNLSKIEWVQSCLHKIDDYMLTSKKQTLAIPKLGCGFGGLKWSEVNPFFDELLSHNEYDVIVFDKNPD